MGTATVDKQISEKGKGKRMKIEKNFLDINRFSRPGLKLKDVYGIVYHYTGGKGHTGKGIRNFFNGLKSQIKKWLKYFRKAKYKYASTQLIVGLKGETIQTMPLDELAYHVGDGGKGNKDLFKRLGLRKGWLRNFYFIGIELCIDKEGNFLKETLEKGIKDGICLMKEYKLGKDRIFRHYDITGKKCPKYFVDNPCEWEKFYKRIWDGME